MEHQRQVRDALITELHARDDVTTRAIGDAARIHHTHVLNIARKAVG
jgi:hypothetical protein